MKTFRSKQTAPPIRRTVSLAVDGEEKLQAAFRRMAEVSRLKAMLPQVTIPERIGKKQTSENDARIFDLAVAAANGNETGEFSSACVKAGAAKASARFFEVAAEAMRQVKASRADKLSSNKAHAIACLVAKLELEQRLERLPDTLETTKRAYQIARAWFRNQLAVHAPDERAAWSKARKAAGLEYLPPAVRGKGQ